ncbi:ATPase [Deltaproteobacteria bacterium]|nr:ATPase [Deltaproteobacteria bacterium]
MAESPQRRFKERAIAGPWLRASASFPVLLLSGPRQTGKTTLLRRLSEDGRAYATLDDRRLRALAKEDPELFLQRFPPPLLVDEIQYAPELLSALKQRVDTDRQPGAFWLTGSQPFHLMRGVSESLAGRIATAQLLGLSAREEDERSPALPPFRPDPGVLAERRATGAALTLPAVFERIWRGALPALVTGELPDRDLVLAGYVETYLERDVRELVNVGSLTQFDRFLRAAAARTAQLLNFADLARDVGVSPTTARTWMSVLEASGVVLLVPPFSTNVTNRIVKTPKLYFLDTGVASWLGGWPTPQTLASGAAAGAMFETWVVGEIVKSWWNNLKRPNLYFYRDHDGREIDLVFDEGHQLSPVEIKLTGTPTPYDARHFAALERAGRVGHGAVICLAPTSGPLTGRVSVVAAGDL